MKTIFQLVLMMIPVCLQAQTYTSYHTGSPSDVTTNTLGGICLMGGAAEHDEAMKWFLERANGGDILVLRTSGSDGYNNYMFSELDVDVNGVETIVFNSPLAVNEIYIQEKIQKAEAIWFAGGDQWNYISYWRGTIIESLINEAINERNIVIGGTSAGMAIQGKYYFSAENGTVTSAQALADPYNSDMTIDSTHFIENHFLENVITDSHYDDPDRKGRHVTFLARLMTDYGVSAKGIACNEYTAVCIDENGLARVYGDYPNYEEAAYFLQTNCALEEPNPELCIPSSPLDWNLGGSAVRVYKVYGTNIGTNTFDLSNWEYGNGGIWQNWYVNNGVLWQTSGLPIDCSTVGIEPSTSVIPNNLYPNPVSDIVHFKSDQNIKYYELYSMHGELLLKGSVIDQSIDISTLSPGVYLLNLVGNRSQYQSKIIKN